MKKTTVILALLAAAMLAFILIYERGTISSRELAQRRDRVLQRFVRDRVSRLEIQRRGKTTVLVREPDEEGGLELGDWQVEEPRLTYQLAITVAGEGRLIGNCGVRLAEAGAEVGDLGYEIAPATWGQGYAAEAAEAMMRFGFEELGLHRIWAHAVAENAASQRVMEKLGMRCEGRLRETQWYKGRWWDTVVYGILEEEWRDRWAGLQDQG